MSEETLRSYRLTSLETPTQSPELRWNPLMREEPSDEMLHAIMEKVAVAARESTRCAEAKKKEMLRIAIENANNKSVVRV